MVIFWLFWTKMSSLSKPVLIGLETGVDDFVGLQSGNEHVEDPEENKD